MPRKNYLVATVLGIFLTFFAAPGNAHTELTGSNPAADSTVASLPNQLVLTFSEAPLAAGTFVRLEQQAGKVTSKIGGKLVGGSMHFNWPGSIKPGEIKVHWRAVSDDGHVVSGEFKFFFKFPSTPSSTQAPEQQNSQTKQIVAWGGLVMLFVLALGIFATTKRKE